MDIVRKYKRSFNKFVRETNQKMCNDKLFLGRFEVHPVHCGVMRYDKDCVTLHVIVRVCDKETLEYKDYDLEYAPWLKVSKLSLLYHLNNFIVSDSNFYKKKERSVKDYRETKIRYGTIGDNPYSFFDVSRLITA